MSLQALKVNALLKPSGNCLLCVISLIFIFSITAFAFTQSMQVARSIENLAAQEVEDEVDAKVLQIIINDDVKAVNEAAAQRLLLANVEQQSNEKKLLAATAQQQVLKHQRKRNVSANEDNQNKKTANQGYYYEEQRPVLVHAESLPTLGRRQDNFGAPPPTSQQYPYYERPAANEYEESEETQKDGDAVNAERYPYEQRPPAASYDDDDDDDEDVNENNERVGGGEAESVGEGRAAQNDAYNSYYRQWHYATPAPVTRQRPNGGWEVGGNRKLQNGERDPYAAYDTDGPLSDYEYPGAPTALQKQQYQQQQQQQQAQNRPQQTPSKHRQAVHGADEHNNPSVTPTSAPTENTLVSTLKSLKTMWDIYQSLSAAWNMLATHQQKQEQQQQEAAKRRQQQIAQQMRINSKKPPKFETNDKFTQSNNSASDVSGGAEVAGSTTTNAAKRVRPNNKATKNPKTTTAKATTTKSTSTTELAVSSELEEMGGLDKKTAVQNAEGKREKRQMSDVVDAPKSTDVGEARYIKGDPLRGYYDFVITEGSYKFWAVFQTGTALLIIYSTFAAIYYSKVNPLVSDYDYVDYLGGARSLSGGDDDFIDDDDSGMATDGNKQRRRSWLNGMLPRAGRTMKYILDALDKLPVDHREADETMKGEHLRLAPTTEREMQTNANDDDDEVATTNESEEMRQSDEAIVNVAAGRAEQKLQVAQRQVRAYAA